MGVKGLWRMIKNCAELESPANKTLAVDISIWIHHYKDMQEKDIVFHISKRIIKLLYHNIKPVFIFDGKPNEMKRRVLNERKRVNNEKLISDIIHNRQCKKCRKSIRTCRHGGILNDKIRNELDAKLKTNLEEYDERWGMAAEDVVEDSKLPKKRSVVIDEHLINEIVNSKKYTRQQKLKMLLKMREKRKEKLGYDDTTLKDFSESQLINIKKRNLISFHIRRLEKEKGTKIQSDCLKEYVYIKNEQYVNKEDPEREQEDEKAVESEESFDKFFEEEDEQDIMSQSDVVVCKSPSDIDNIYQSCILRLEKYKESEKYNDKQTKQSILDEPKITRLSTSKGEKLRNGFITSERTDDNDFSSSGVEDSFKVNIDDQYDYQTVKKFTGKLITLDDCDENFDFSRTQTIIKNIIEVFQLPFLIPPGEADSQCGYLSREGLVDGVITEDNDVLLYGGVVYRNFFKRNKLIEKFTPEGIQNTCGFSQNDLINLSYVLGSDYTLGIHGIGIKKAVDYIKSEDFLNLDIANYSSIYLSPVVDKSFTPTFNIVDLKKLHKFFKYKGLETEKINELLFYLKNRV